MGFITEVSEPIEGRVEPKAETAKHVIPHG
jgi:hypothetical protein